MQIKTPKVTKKKNGNATRTPIIEEYPPFIIFKRIKSKITSDS
jgi:hypothetical protein